ncbi:MAG: hypothetical protein LBD38_03560 [Streptococcaceae bacterium]|jgi:hypothetical protein|nr:hypothetical protein [Streptococcaceae bacterium]
MNCKWKKYLALGSLVLGIQTSTLMMSPQVFQDLQIGLVGQAVTPVPQLVIHKIESDSPNTYNGEKILPNENEAKKQGAGSYYVDQTDGNLKQWDGTKGTLVNPTIIEGVTFKAFNITAFYTKIVDALKSQSPGSYTFDGKTSSKTNVKEAAHDILNQMIQNFPFGDFSVDATVLDDDYHSALLKDASEVKTQTTGSNGQAFFPMQEKTTVTDAGGTNIESDSVYAIYETGHPSDGKTYSTAMPMLVRYPLYAADEPNVVHVYPKNSSDEMQKELITVFDNQDGASIGDEVYYQITVPLPEEFSTGKVMKGTDEVWKYDTVTVFEAPSPGLQFVEWQTYDGNPIQLGSESVLQGMRVSSVAASGLEFIPQNTQNGVGFYPYNDADRNRRLIKNGPLVLRGKLLVTEEVPIEVDAGNNRASFEIKNSSDSSIPPLDGDSEEAQPKTFGYKFLKVDVEATSTHLIGAKFRVEATGGLHPETHLTVNTPIEFIKVSDGVYRVAKPGEASSVTEIEVGSVAGTIGQLKISGLEQGDYALIETQAPDGYLKPTDPISFEINSTTYTDSDQTGDLIAGNGQHEVGNVKRGLLPGTGGSGFWGILILGVALGVLTISLRRAKQKVAVESDEI